MTAIHDVIAGLPQLISYWPCNDGSGSTVADVTGTGANLTGTGFGISFGPAIVPGDPTGYCMIGNATVTSSSLNTLTGNFLGVSIGCFVNPLDLVGGGSQRFLMQIGFLWQLYFRQNNFIGSGPTIPSNQSMVSGTPGAEMIAAHNLYLAILRFSSTTWSLNLNGNVVASGTVNSLPNPNSGAFNLGDTSLKTQIQHAFVVARYISDAECQLIAQAGLAPAGHYAYSGGTLHWTGPKTYDVFPWSTQLLPANPGRNRLHVVNPSDTWIAYGLGGDAAAGGGGQIPSFGQDDIYTTQSLSAIIALAPGSVMPGIVKTLSIQEF